MHVNGYLPYVGITASEMIEKLDIHFISSNKGLLKVDDYTQEVNPANPYERKLYFQSQWEKAGHGVY